METGLETKLEVHMFGGFTISYGGRPITFGRGGTGKAVQLLQILLIHQRGGISKEKLMQDLYDWETVSDRNNSLNSVIYRLKKQLIAAGMPQEEYISLKNGICYWNGSMDTWVDTVAMEDLAAQASDKDEAEQIELLKEACDIYSGEFLPHLSGETWVTVENLRLKRIYEDMVCHLCQLLEARQEYRQTYDIYTKAASLYPYEEWQAHQIDSLLEMNRYEEAYNLYLKATKMYSDELGLPPSEEMMKRLQRMSGKLVSRESNLAKVQNMLTEGQSVRGAYFCSYPSFVDVYRFVCRQLERSGQSVFLMMCSIRSTDGLNRWEKEASDWLLTAIGSALRRGDIYTRYSSSQSLILLSGTRSEYCEIIYNRICHEFYLLCPEKRFQIDYEVATIAEVGEQEPEMRFKRKAAW